MLGLQIYVRVRWIPPCRISNSCVWNILGQHVLHKIIIGLSKISLLRNPFDCVGTPTVRFRYWLYQGSERIFVMFEAVTALLGVMSAGIFLAHAVDSYRMR